MSDLPARIEAILFALGRPISREELAKKLAVSVEELKEALAAISEEERGIFIIDDGRELQLRTSPSAAALIEKIRKEEYSRDIGKAGLEALSAILYRGPLTRAEIDFIRGVNSSQTLRTLSVRGLVRRIPNPKDERSFVYEPTTELLAQLGVSHVEELPEFTVIKEKLAVLEEAYRAKESTDTI